MVDALHTSPILDEELVLALSVGVLLARSQKHDTRDENQDADCKHDAGSRTQCSELVVEDTATEDAE